MLTHFVIVLRHLRTPKKCKRFFGFACCQPRTVGSAAERRALHAMRKIPPAKTAKPRFTLSLLCLTNSGIRSAMQALLSRRGGQRFTEALLFPPVRIPLYVAKRKQRHLEQVPLFSLAGAAGIYTNTNFYCRQSFFETAFALFVLFLA